MQQLASESTEDQSIEMASPSDCSTQLIEVTPLLMRRIRREMRQRTMPGLSIPLFRTMRYLWDNPGASLSDVANALGHTMPSASKLVQRLVLKKVVERRVAEDRRRVHLTLTEEGRSALALARLETARNIEEGLKSLSKEELATVSAALRILGKTLAQGGIGVNIH